MRTIIRIIAGAVLVTTAASCGTAVRTGSSSMYLSIETLTGIRGATSPGQPSSNLTSDVVTKVTSGGKCSQASPCDVVFNDVGSASLRLVPKNPISGPAPSSTNDVTISRVHIEYKRTDGHNTPGVDVPYPIDSFVTVTVPGSGSASVGFELVRIQAKEESPLVQLALPGAGFIAAVCEVTFFGQDRAGNAISATGTITAEFGDFADQ